MILNIFKTILLSSSFTLTIASCNLDQFPKDAISKENAWLSVKDAVRFSSGNNSLFRGVNGSGSIYITDLQSDLFNLTISFGNRGGGMHRWDFISSEPSVGSFWNNNYILINNCNNIIDNIDKLTAKDDDEKIKLKNIKGEAFLMRAISYHTLVVRFAKDYEPSSAKADKGLPLLLKFDNKEKLSRSSLEDTYKQIKKDIADARTLLTEPGKSNAVYLTTDVINAIEARVNLYMHNYAEAITQAKALIDKYPLNNDISSFKEMWLNDESSEIILKLCQAIDERNYSMGSYLAYNVGSKRFNPDIVPSKWILDLYEDNDIRKEVFYRKDTILCLDKEVTDVYMLNKYLGNPALKKSEYEYYHMPKVFRVAESYLIAAEAAYRLGDASAITYLNQLRSKRGASTITASGEELFKKIKEEWIREFIGEGQRLNDLKRWHDDIKRHDPQNSSILMKGDDYTELSKSANDKRVLWEIPLDDLKSNTNLTSNWE